jgi:hypothetical protein
MLFAILNSALVLFVLLIAYWWANQGLFSALLHLLCVIIAGAIALAFWEPVTLGLLIRGTRFDDYAWGVSLVSLFVISLLILRVISDKTIRANVDLPHWANLAFGFPVGALAGSLTIGLFVIGAGHIQTQREFMGLNGWQRTGSGQVAKVEDVPMWCMAPQIASGFYGWLSGGALSTRTPLREYSPELYKQTTLLRDGATDSKDRLLTKTSLPGDAAEVLDVFKVTDTRQWAVKMRFNKPAYDGGGQQLALSAAQVRLLGRSRGREAPVVHPIAWAQKDSTGTIGVYKLDTPSHYMTSVQAQDNVEFVMLFPAFPGETEARFIQVRGTRFALPAAKPIASNELDGVLYGLGRRTGEALVLTDPSRPTLKRDELVQRRMLPFISSMNNLPGGVKLEGQDIFEAIAEFPKSLDIRPPRKLTVDQIYQTPNTRILQLDVSHGATADLFGRVRRELGDSVRPMLVDASGNTYPAIGYIHDKGQRISVMIDRTEGVGSLAALPHLPSSRAESMLLIFEVTVGAEIVAFRLNNQVVANGGLTVTPEGLRGVAPPPEEEEPEEVPQE